MSTAEKTTETDLNKEIHYIKWVKTSANWAMGTGGLTGASLLYILTMPQVFDPALVISVSIMMFGIAYLGLQIRRSESGRVWRLYVILSICSFLLLIGFIPSSDGSIGHPVQGFLVTLLLIFGLGLWSARKLDKIAKASRPIEELNVKQSDKLKVADGERQIHKNNWFNYKNIFRLNNIKIFVSIIVSFGFVWGIVSFVDYMKNSQEDRNPELALTKEVPDMLSSRINASLGDLITDYGPPDETHMNGTQRFVTYRSLDENTFNNYYTTFQVKDNSVVGFYQNFSSMDYVGVDLVQNRLVMDWYKYIEVIESKLGKPDTSMISDSLWFAAWRDDKALSEASKYGDLILFEYESISISPSEETIIAIQDTASGRFRYHYGSEKKLSISYYRRQRPRQ